MSSQLAHSQLLGSLSPATFYKSYKQARKLYSFDVIIAYSLSLWLRSLLLAKGYESNKQAKKLYLFNVITACSLSWVLIPSYSL